MSHDFANQQRALITVQAVELARQRFWRLLAGIDVALVSRSQEKLRRWSVPSLRLE